MSNRIDKGDLRLKKRPNPEYKTDYARIAIRVSNKLCYICGITPVKDRKVCIECSKRASNHNAISGFRKVLKLAGIEHPMDAWDILAQVKNDANAHVIGALMHAIEACDYKHHKG